MKKVKWIALIVTLLLVDSTIDTRVVNAQEKTEKTPAPTAPIPKCPVTGNPANLAVSTPTPDGPVYFFNNESVTAYKADPAKFVEAVTAQRAVLATRPRIQVKCPVSGDPPNPKIKAEKSGQKVAFCSEECRTKYLADPAKYASALANSYTHQTICPVMGEPIDPEVYTLLPSGQTMYFCCKPCIKKWHAEPEKYAPALQKQGFTFDFTKAKKEGE